MTSQRIGSIALLCLALLVPAVHATAQNGTPGPIDQQARALLARCLTCHGATRPEGGLNLTTRTTALKGGVSGAAFLPGNAEKSLLYRRIAAKQMPPGTPLSPAEIEVVRRWITAGAAWSNNTPQRAGNDWWSLRPLTASRIPAIAMAHSAGQRSHSNPIDAFIEAQRKAHGLTMASPADRVTLLRRVTYDLIGMPPTPEEIDRFLADRSPSAYARVVDRLLADPRYGERWGRHWLDIVRFGESNGFERDQLRPNAWRYRDYVIDSFNHDKPYAEFIKQQLAGDVMEPHSQEGIVATGFLVCGPWDEVGNTQVSEVMRARVHEEEMEDRVGTVCQTFLGLTVNCARCHDHKFDPILQRDYYRIKAALDGVHNGDRSLLTTDQEHERALRLAQTRHDLDTIDDEIARIEDTAARRVRTRPHTANRISPPVPMARWDFEQNARDTCGALHGILMNGAHVAHGRLILDGNGAYMKTPPLPVTLREKTLEAWVALPDRAQRGGAVLSVQSSAGHTFDAIVYGERQAGKWMAGSEFFRRTRDLPIETESASPNALIHIAIVYRADNSIAVYRNGTPVARPYIPTGENATLQTFPAGTSEVLIGLRHTGAGNGFLRGEVEEARLYDHALSPSAVYTSYLAGPNQVDPEERNRALTATERVRRNALLRDRNTLQSAFQALQEPQQTYAAMPVQPEPTHILLRGDVESKGDVVAAGGLSCVAKPPSDLGLAADAPEGVRRLRLAEWIADPANPLTARVIVNRIWHYHFGRGIVGSPNDFGFNGERPTHPELLDWLAVTFVRNGGHMKPLHRLILLSNTYQQSARYDAASNARDAEDRLLWRFPPHRLEGEAIRDAMLAISGQLNPQRGGPSFRPFTELVDNSHFYTLTDSPDPEFNRRTVYRINVNSAKSPLLEALDCPDPSTKTPRRTVTTTPLQALELMNSRFVQRQAHCFAARLAKEAGPSLPARINRAYRLAFGRIPTKSERQRAVAFAHSQGMDSFCWALFNATEFLYIP